MYEEVIRFWFDELDASCWWTKSDELDATICGRFGATHTAAVAGELEAWRQSAEGRLAEVIAIDQFSRNIYRDRAESFAWDSMALALAQEAIRAGADQELAVERRAFLYLPFMHSESLAIHERAVELFSQPGLENNLDFEHKHKAIIDRFGRYPHRNEVLGRESTPEEIEFLRQPGSSF
jgi:uncharacterized protein (DUF924 family)